METLLSEITGIALFGWAVVIIVGLFGAMALIATIKQISNILKAKKKENAND